MGSLIPAARRLVPWLAPVVVMLVMVACGDDDDPAAATAASGAAASATTTPGDALTGAATVFAAASLSDAFEAIAEEFEAVHPGVTIEFNFASSSALATQIEEGAPADIFASADTAQMERLAGASLVAQDSGALFARNVPVIVVPADNPTGITDLAGLATAGLKLVLAAEDVPIGRYARQIIDRLAADPGYGEAFRAAVIGNIVSNEENVRAVLTKIELGEGDAGIVYATDAAVASDKVIVIAIPERLNVIADYPIALVTASDATDVGQAFIDFVLGAEGQRILAEFGFIAPS